MRNLAFILLGFVTLIAQTGLSVGLPLHPFEPNLLLPIAIYLGVSHDIGVVRGASISFVLGYFLDSFSGSPMGLQTLVMVATFLVARGAGLRLFLRGPLFQVGLTLVMGLGGGGTMLALRAIFGPPPPFPSDDLALTIRGLVAPALSTALMSPLVFAAVRRMEALFVKQREDGAVAL